MTRIVAVDPGPTPGIAVLSVDAVGIWTAEVLQCTAGLLMPLVAELLSIHPKETRLAVERFVVRGRATRDQAVTRDQVAALQQLHPRAILRSAVQVKPWATDRRLQAAVLTSEDTSLFLRTAGMCHARDAARHALFAAVHDDGLPDPLSRKATR